MPIASIYSDLIWKQSQLHSVDLGRALIRVERSLEALSVQKRA